MIPIAGDHVLPINTLLVDKPAGSRLLEHISRSIAFEHKSPSMIGAISHSAVAPAGSRTLAARGVSRMAVPAFAGARAATPRSGFAQSTTKSASRKSLAAVCRAQVRQRALTLRLQTLPQLLLGSIGLLGVHGLRGCNWVFANVLYVCAISMVRSHTGNLCFTPQAVPAVAPLVGGQAPDFEAQAVYDQEFVTVKLSDYKVE